MARKASHQTQLVLQSFLDAANDETYGFELAEATGLPAGTIYPILSRLEKDGLLEGRWVEVESRGQRRRRRYYSLTGHGRRAAYRATADQREALRLLMPGWKPA